MKTDRLQENSKATTLTVWDTGRDSKKKALIFATENIDLNFFSYKLLSITKKDKKVTLNVEKRDLLEEGQYKTAVVIYGANTYIIESKKSKLKNVKKVKVTYDFVRNSEE